MVDYALMLIVGLGDRRHAKETAVRIANGNGLNLVPTYLYVYRQTLDAPTVCWPQIDH